MKDAKLYTLIMAGGQGTRFWPESTSKNPKQYLKLLGDNSLLFETLKRFEGLVEVNNRFVVTVNAQKQLVKDNSNGLLTDSGIIFEPAGRNTAPCILLSLAELIVGGATASDVVAIVPSDHVILNTEGFRDVIREAFELSIATNNIFTIGIPTSFPHTGYGYIQKGESIRDGAYRVQEFKEKPDFETAKGYVESGEYFWNAGMFVGSIGLFLQEFEVLAPKMYEHFDELKESILKEIDLTEVYEKIPRDSIDFAIMEKSKKVSVISARFDWNDLGSWDALEAVVEKTENNTIINSLGSYIENASGNIVYSSDKFVSLINVNDLVIVSNDKNILVLPKSDSQKVKNIVEYLKTTSFKDELL